MRKALVIGVILLFLGVGFQPATANEVSITQTSDNEDCLDCQPASRVELLKVKLLLIRLEILSKIILPLIKHIPEINEEYEELSKRISTLSEMNKELTQFPSYWYFPIICGTLLSIIISILFVIVIIEIMLENLVNFPIIYNMIGYFGLKLVDLLNGICNIALMFGCIPGPPYKQAILKMNNN